MLLFPLPKPIATTFFGLYEQLFRFAAWVLFLHEKDQMAESRSTAQPFALQEGPSVRNKLEG